MNFKNGFTLIEVLMVLSILSAALLLLTPMNDLFLEKQREKQFIREFSSDMLLLQSYSRTTLSKVRFIYSKEEGVYKINKGRDPLIERELPKGWRFKMLTYSEDDAIQYAYSGSIKGGGHIVLKTRNNSYTFFFAPGKGRFRIEKN